MSINKDLIVFVSCITVGAFVAGLEVGKEQEIDNCTKAKTIKEVEPRNKIVKPSTYCSKYNVVSNQKQCIQWKLRNVSETIPALNMNTSIPELDISNFN